MLFVEFRFFAFFALVFAVAWLLRRDGWRKSWLLLCSYVFYGAWNWKFLSLIWISTVVDYTVAQLMERTEQPLRRKLLLTVSMAANLGLLGIFKYFNFFVDSAAALAELLGFQPHLPTLSVLLPVGISFYTFQTMSYTIDVYRRVMPATRNAIDFALFVAFFPQLVAGPIVRARDFMPQLASRPVFGAILWRPALVLFLLGFFKKACVSDNIAPFVDAYFADPGSFDALSSWIAVCLYSVQIYCDFSGYSATSPSALRRVLGYRLCMRNFDAPVLLAANPSPSSGGAGTSHCPPGSGTTSTSPWAGTGTATGGHVSESHDHNGPGRPVARRKLELRHLGHSSRG